MRLKLKLQHFGHLMRRIDSLEKTLMLGTLASSLRSPAEGEGHEGFPPPPDKDRGSLECNPEIPAFPGEEN